MPFDPTRLITLEAVAFDVDGVLTDGTLTWSSNTTEEIKTFSFADIMALSLLRRLPIHRGLISGEDSPLAGRYAQKLHIPFLALGTRDKATALRNFTTQFNIPLPNTCFFGDDVNDIPAMELAGLCACPANAATEVRNFVAAANGFLSTKPGGNGAVREFVDAILTARNLRGRDVFQLSPPN